MFRKALAVGAGILGVGGFVVLAGGVVWPRPEFPVTLEFVLMWIACGVVFCALAIWLWRDPTPKDRGGEYPR